MTKNEYLKYILSKNLLVDRETLFSMFIVPKKTKPNQAIKLINDEVNVLVDGEYIKLVDGSIPLFSSNDKMILDSTSIPNITGTIETTFGLAIANFFLTHIGLSDKIPFINESFTVKTLEKLMLPKFVDDEDVTEDTFSPIDRNNLSKAITFIEDLANIIVVSKGRTTIHPRKGIEAFKANLVKEMRKKYGDSLFKEEKHFIEFNKAIQQFDREGMKKDPSLGIVTSNKIIGQSRTKLYGSFGYSKNPFNPDTPGTMITKPLNDGYDLAEDKLPVYINSSRAGSLFRGVETQDSGSTAKTLINTAISMIYVDGDCGSTETYDVVLKDYEKYNMRYIQPANKPILIKDFSKFKNTLVKLRDPMFCKSGANKCCRVCSGEYPYNAPHSIIGQFTAIGGKLLNADMKKMHGKDLSNIRISFNK